MSYIEKFLEGYTDGINELSESVHQKVAKKTKRYIIKQVEDDDSPLMKDSNIQTYNFSKDGSKHSATHTSKEISVYHPGKDGKEYITNYQFPDKLLRSHLTIGKKDLTSKGIAQATVGHESGHGKFASGFVKSVDSGEADPIMARVAGKREYEREKNRKQHNSSKNGKDSQRAGNFSEYYADRNAREVLKKVDPKHADTKMRKYFRHVSRLDKSEKKLPNAKEIKANRVLDSVDRKQALKEVDKLRADSVTRKDPTQTIKYKQGMAGGKKAYEKEVKKRKLQKKLREELLNYYLENYFY